MDNQGDNFAGGFLAGAVFGSIVGGALGALLVSRLPETSDQVFLESNPEGKPRKRRKRQLKEATELNIEEARQGLEAKIAQLNDAIDDVRRQLSNVNGDVQNPDE